MYKNIKDFVTYFKCLDFVKFKYCNFLAISGVVYFHIYISFDLYLGKIIIWTSLAISQKAQIQNSKPEINLTQAESH